MTGRPKSESAAATQQQHPQLKPVLKVPALPVNARPKSQKVPNLPPLPKLEAKKPVTQKESNISDAYDPLDEDNNT
jgi:hypothetical protein